VLLGVLDETFETAFTCGPLRRPRRPTVTPDDRRRCTQVCGRRGRVTCRLTHAYPDGAAPYFTVLAPARRGSEVAQWDDVKAAAGEALLAAGGTITHHHAVGRDHRPWYDRSARTRSRPRCGEPRPAVDPAGVLNPGVLLDP
jgi:alkyldihydroxyacetonephosphate synthase